MVMMPGVSRNFSEADYVAKLIKRGSLYSPNVSAGWTAAVTGSGASSAGAVYQDVTTGVTASSTARRYADLYVISPGVQNNRFNWDKKTYFIINFHRTITEAEVVGRIQFKEVTTEGALGAKGVGIRFDNLALVGESYGTSLGTVDLSTTLTSAEGHQIIIIHYPASKIEWYFNGVLKGTQSTAGKIPSGLSGGIHYAMVSIVNGATGGTNAELALILPTIFQVL